VRELADLILAAQGYDGGNDIVAARPPAALASSR
jgi:hypothetical protein